MTAANAKDYLPAVEALRDGELEERFTHGWEFVIHAEFDKPPDHYRRRPKPIEGFTIEKDLFSTKADAERMWGMEAKIIHVREVLP